jgi:hypothetical protein
MGFSLSCCWQEEDFGADAPNDIDTLGNNFSITLRCYRVSQKVMDGKTNPEETVK